MVRNCPACSTEMRVETVYDVQLDVCPECAGIWFDSEELRSLRMHDPLALPMLEDKVVPHVMQKPAGPSEYHCPDCNLPLEQYHYLYNSPIVLHGCTNVPV